MNTRLDIFMILLVHKLSSLEIEASQQFIKIPTYTEVNPGEDALLQCRVSNKKGVCSWQKDRKPVGIFDEKYVWANENGEQSGDCSLLVRAATLQQDDGEWQCQVTASKYNTYDALSSPPATLAVRVPPQSPRILVNGSYVKLGRNITVSTGARATVACEVRYGNPPAYIEWYLEKERLTAWSQTNSSEPEKPRVWAARSVLELGATRSAHGRQLVCRAYHPSYPSPHYRDSYTVLDVTYAPAVSIVGSDAATLANLEEGLSTLALECRADGNPSPYVWWTRNGLVIATNGPNLTLTPVNRNNSGIYGCQARNPSGTSSSVKIEIDVKYPPKVTWVGPDTVVEAKLFSEVTLECKAEGNPPPSYQWYHDLLPSDFNNMHQEEYPISSTAHLHLNNVSYAQHGRYTCAAMNEIGQEERRHQSEFITLKVLGPPVGPETGSAHAWSGGEARMHVTVCAAPPPRKASWSWGSMQLDVPSNTGRYRTTTPSADNGCYRYTLLIMSTTIADDRLYTLHVENERGLFSHIVSLTVHASKVGKAPISSGDEFQLDNFSLTETTYVAPLIAAALAVAALLVVVLCFIIRCRRRRANDEFRADDLDSEKVILPADAVYTREPGSSVAAVSGRGIEAGAAGAAGPAGGPASRYSPGALQVALSSLKQEAKENAYAMLEPHVQYDITINKNGEPPKYFSLSKPLTHQRNYAYDNKYYNEINNNDIENKFTTFKSVPNIRRSTKSNERKIKTDERKNYVCNSNQDIQYSKDPFFGMLRNNEGTVDIAQSIRHNEMTCVNNTRMYVRNNSGRTKSKKSFVKDAKRASNRSRNMDVDKGAAKIYFYTKTDEKQISKNNVKDIEDDCKPKPGKVKEIASIFDRNSVEYLRGSNLKKERPKPLQSYGCQAYLDHVFPDAVEI